MTAKYHYICNDCGTVLSATEATYLCPSCSAKNTATEPPKGVLKTIYDFESIKTNHDFQAMQRSGFIDILPIQSCDSLPFLKTGNTPLYSINELNNENLGFQLFLKDDSQNPTYSFKDRASALVSAYAKENNITTIVAASTGNAGSSLAGLCAAQKQKAVIFVPAAAPKAKLTQIVMYGATIVPIDGTYDNAFDLSIEATKKFGWYNRNTAFNPFTIEGKKTVSLELFGQLGQHIPDKVFVPVGDGVIISGVYKGFEDLLNLGFIDKMPVIIAVQAEGSCNIVRNMNTDKFESIPSNTTADSISVDIPRNFYMAKKFLKTYSGETCMVSDDEILNASAILSRNTGVFAEPAATAAFAGMLRYKAENKINLNEKVVVLLTGSGLKDLNSVQKIIEIPKPVKPDIESIISFLKM
jgi:threonine synthase